LKKIASSVLAVAVGFCVPASEALAQMPESPSQAVPASDIGATSDTIRTVYSGERDPAAAALMPPPPMPATVVNTATAAAGTPALPPPLASELPAGPRHTTMAVGMKMGMGALVDSWSNEPIDFNFQGTDIVGILRTFATKFKKNIIAAPDVHGRVNLQLRGVPFDEGFRTLLDQMGLVAIQESANVIEIIKATEMPVLMEVFPLKYRFAIEIATTLNGLIKGKDREVTIISSDSAANAVIVTSTNDVMQRMKVIIAQMDIPAPQVAIKARLIEVQVTDSLNWGITWARSTPFGTGNNHVVRSIFDQKNFTLNGDGTVNTTQAPTFFPTGGILDISTVLDKASLYALVNFLKSNNTTKTISEPMVLTGNNKTAKIHVGQNLPVKTSQVTQTATVQSVQYIPEGVDLEVTPIVAPGSTVISFKVKVGVSEFVGFQSDSPITTERVATTEVSVESGKTVVIGGLIKDKTLDEESGIPFLKDIPILGWLFKNKKKSKDKTELLIFITPELQATTF